MLLEQVPGFRETRDHWWWRPGWSPGRRFLTLHLTFESTPELASSISRWSAGLDDVANVRTVPDQWLHLTMTGLGFADEVETDRVVELAAEVFAAAARLDVQPLAFDRLMVHPEALVLRARPDSWLLQLEQLQRAAVTRLDPAPVGPSYDFIPHVSVAYFDGPVEVSALAEAARRAEPVVVTGPNLSLIELGRDDQVYTWRVVAQRVLD